MPAEGAAYDAMLAALKSNDIVKGKFLSEDGELALIVIALDRHVVHERSARTVIGEIKRDGRARAARERAHRQADRALR